MKKILLLLILLLNLHITINDGLITLEAGHASAQIQYEETLDDLVVPGNAYGECQFCHAHILKTELAFHQQYQCYYREATCETCHQKYRPAQGDCSCKDNIYNNNNGNDYTICYRCGRYKDQCTCNSNNPYDINNPPGGGGGGGGSNSGSGNTNSEDSNIENDSDVTAGERYWEDKANCISPNDLKSMAEVNMIDYLPDSFVPQGPFPDCVARAFATSIYLLSKGDLSQYDLAYSLALTEANIKGINLAADGIDPRKFDKFLGEAFIIQTHSPDEYTKDTIFNYINNNQPVISSMDTDYTIPLRQKGVHAVTIVAYDLQFYYCAYGGNDVVKIPHSEIGKYPIYVTTGLK